MPKLAAYTLSLEELTGNANSIKEVLLNALDREGLLKEPAETLNSKFAVVIHQKGFFGRVIDKLRGVSDDSENLQISIVRVL